jgi:L-lysine 6-transaminase
VRTTRILEAIEADDLAANATAMGEHLLAGLRRLAEADERVTNVRGRGLLCALDLPRAEARDHALVTARERGLLAIACGTRSLRFRPALTVSRAEVDHCLDLLAETLKARA